MKTYTPYNTTKKQREATSFINLDTNAVTYTAPRCVTNLLRNEEEYIIWHNPSRQLFERVAIEHAPDTIVDYWFVNAHDTGAKIFTLKGISENFEYFARVYRLGVIPLESSQHQFADSTEVQFYSRSDYASMNPTLDPTIYFGCSPVECLVSVSNGSNDPSPIAYGIDICDFVPYYTDKIFCRVIEAPCNFLVFCVYKPQYRLFEANCAIETDSSHTYLYWQCPITGADLTGFYVPNLRRSNNNPVLTTLMLSNSLGNYYRTLYSGSDYHGYPSDGTTLQAIPYYAHSGLHDNRVRFGDLLRLSFPSGAFSNVVNYLFMKV